MTDLQWVLCKAYEKVDIYKESDWDAEVDLVILRNINKKFKKLQ